TSYIHTESGQASQEEPSCQRFICLPALRRTGPQPNPNRPKKGGLLSKAGIFRLPKGSQRISSPVRIAQLRPGSKEISYKNTLQRERFFMGLAGLLAETTA